MIFLFLILRSAFIKQKLLRAHVFSRFIRLYSRTLGISINKKKNSINIKIYFAKRFLNETKSDVAKQKGKQKSV